MNYQLILLFLMLFSGGIIAGFLSGLLGIGGGVVYIPLLMFVAQLSIIEPLSSIHVIIATSLFAGMFSSSMSFYYNKKTKNLNFKDGILLAIGAVLAGLIVPHFIVKVESDKMKILIGTAVGLIGLFMLFEDRLKLSNKIKLPRWSLFITGVLIGTLSVSVGLGGGVFYTPVLVYLYSFDIKKAIGTAIVAVASTMLVSCSMFMFFTGSVSGDYQIGYVNLFAALPLAVGASIGPRIGVNLLHKVSLTLLRKIFSIFLILYSLKMFGI